MFSDLEIGPNDFNFFFIVEFHLQIFGVSVLFLFFKLYMELDH